MARSARDAASRASMDYDTMRRDGGSSAERRRATVHESMRKTAGPEAIVHWAKANANIVVSDTNLNVDMVNDGAGWFRRAQSLDEVVDYGTEREDRVVGLRDGHRVGITVVGHLPMGLCEEIPDAYEVRDEDGTVVGTRPRLVARDRKEALRYFRDFVVFQATRLPGGRAAVHGFSINFDEDRPHIQVLADPFEAAPTKSDPTRLKNGYSRAFGSHPSDRLVEVETKGGEPKMVREGARRKMRRHHQEFKEFMVGRGWEIELERDPERHARKDSQEDYKRLAEAGRVLGIKADAVEAREAAVADAEAAVAVREAGLDARETEVETAEAALPSLRRKSKEEGREEGRAEGQEVGRREGRREGLEQGRVDAQAVIDQAHIEARQIESRAYDRAEEIEAGIKRDALARVGAQLDAAEANLPAAYVAAAKKLPGGKNYASLHELLTAKARDEVTMALRRRGRAISPEAVDARMAETVGERDARTKASAAAIQKQLYGDGSQSQQRPPGRSCDGPSM